MQLTKTCTALFAALLVLCLVPAFARADAAKARKYIDDAKDCGEHHNWDDAENRLKLAEGEIDDAPAADKAAVAKEIEDARKSLLSARREYDRPGFIQSIKRYMEDARDNVTVSGAVERAEEQLEYKFKSDEGKFLLSPEEIAAYRKELAGYKKVAMKNKAAEEFKRIAPLMDELEKKFPDHADKEAEEGWSLAAS